MTETLTNTITTSPTNKEISTMRPDHTSMPPTITNKAIATAAAELTRLAREASVAKEAAAALEAARAEVEALDRAALGRALAEGKADPGTNAIDDHDRAIAEAHRRHEALESAVVEAGATFSASVTRHGAAWLEALELEAGKARARYASTVAAMVAARAQVDELAATARWIRRWPSPKGWVGPVHGPVFGLLGRNAEAMPWAEVAGALQADAAA